MHDGWNSDHDAGGDSGSDSGDNYK